MGLTIHYTVTFQAPNSQKVLSSKLEKIRQKCLDLPFEEVGEVKAGEITQQIIDFWNKLQSLGYRGEPLDELELVNLRDSIFDALGTSTHEVAQNKREFENVNSLDEFIEKTSNSETSQRAVIICAVFHIFSYLITNSQNHKRKYLMELRDMVMELFGTTTWQIIRAMRHVKEKERDGSISYREELKPSKVTSLNIWPGKGCESSDLNFYKRGKWWTCRSFTKTQYAEEFVKCHLLVVRLMDMLKEEGFSVDVCDEGDYWETRDLEKLADNINQYTSMIKSIFGTLIKKGGFDNIEAPITECENYMKVNKKKEEDN
jgi:hypothetical protein